MTVYCKIDCDSSCSKMAAIRFGFGPAQTILQLLNQVRIELFSSKLWPFKELLTTGNVLLVHNRRTAEVLL